MWLSKTRFFTSGERRREFALLKIEKKMWGFWFYSSRKRSLKFSEISVLTTARASARLYLVESLLHSTMMEKVDNVSYLEI